VWSRDGNVAYRMGRAIQAGRVWTNCYHAYPAHAAFGGYKESGIGRETHKVMLDHYQQTKNLLVSYRAALSTSASSQYEYWKHTQLIIDVIDGHGGTFSLEGPEGKAFHTRSREAEKAALGQPPPGG
jgi:hypothetical protein